MGASALLHFARSRLLRFGRDDGIVVVEVSKDVEMEVQDMPPALQERLGPEGTAALVELLEQARQDWTMDVTTAAVERFERRLTDAHATLREDMIARDVKLRAEMLASDAKLREEMVASHAKLREDMLASNAKLREDMLAGNAKLREEMQAGDAQLRLEMIHGFASVREDMGTMKFDLLKWSFAFWIGQLVAVTTIVGVMLRVMQT